MMLTSIPYSYKKYDRAVARLTDWWVKILGKLAHVSDLCKNYNK
jgi:hypothetical protein